MKRMHPPCRVDRGKVCRFMYPSDDDNRWPTGGQPSGEPAPATPPAEPPSPPAETTQPPAYTGEVSGWHSPSSDAPSSGLPSVEPTGSGPAPADPVSYPSTSYHYATGHSYDPYGWQQPAPPPAPDKKPDKKKKKSGASIALAALGVICAGTIVTLSVMLAVAMNKNNVSSGNDDTGSTPSSSDSTKNNGNTPKVEINGADEKADALNTQQIIQKNLNSTVVIATYEENTSYNPFASGGNDSSDSDGDDDNPGLTKASSATGIVMTKDGYIITNRHCVINEQTNIQYAQIDVKTYDGKVYKKATVIGVDKDTDLAVIKINAKDLTPAVFGDSSQLQLGDKVVALGNSGGLEWTPTQGIISGLARDVYDDTGYSIKCLQTDAAINPGNSGGPLINSSGQVIGINSAKIVASGYESLGFSIPINEAKDIIDNLIQNGYVKGRVSLGITGSTYTSTNSNYNGFQIQSINSDSSLAGTEAQAGDIITHVDNVRVTNYAKLRTQLSAHKVGDKVTLTLLHVDTRSRQVKTITVTCTLQESAGG